jgi:hypothetical protein
VFPLHVLRNLSGIGTVSRNVSVKTKKAVHEKMSTLFFLDFCGFSGRDDAMCAPFSGFSPPSAFASTGECPPRTKVATRHHLTERAGGMHHPYTNAPMYRT